MKKKKNLEYASQLPFLKEAERRKESRENQRVLLKINVKSFETGHTCQFLSFSFIAVTTL